MKKIFFYIFRDNLYPVSSVLIFLICFFTSKISFTFSEMRLFSILAGSAFAGVAEFLQDSYDHSKLSELFKTTPEDFDVSEDDARKQFENFLLEYPKMYSAQESHSRFQTFWENLKRIKFHNHIEQGSAKYGVTEFTDLSDYEFRRHYLGLKPELKNPNRKKYERKARNSSKKLKFSKSADETFDWVEKGAVTEVKNQGMCGSCWAFSTTGNIEGAWFKATGDLISLSEQELVDCDQKDSGCNGGLMDQAFEEVIRIGGLETEQQYPYDGVQETCNFEQSLSKVQIDDFMDIGEDEDEIAEALEEHGPLSIAINAFGMQFYRGGVSHPLSFLCSPDGLDHGVLMVGYGVEHHTTWRHRHPRPYWKIKNSWGPRWGEDGYYRVARGKGVCGVNKMVSTSIVNPQNATIIN